LRTVGSAAPHRQASAGLDLRTAGLKAVSRLIMLWGNVVASWQSPPESRRHPCVQSLPGAGGSLVLVGGPITTPLALGAFAARRWCGFGSVSRSNSARPPKTVSISLPCGVVVSGPNCPRSGLEAGALVRDRAEQIQEIPGRPRQAIEAWSRRGHRPRRAGRSGRASCLRSAFAPEIFSWKISVQPAAFSSADPVAVRGLSHRSIPAHSQEAPFFCLHFLHVIYAQNITREIKVNEFVHNS